MRKNVKNGLAAAVCVLFVFIIAAFAEQSTARAVGTPGVTESPMQRKTWMPT